MYEIANDRILSNWKLWTKNQNEFNFYGLKLKYLNDEWETMNYDLSHTN